MALAMVTVVIHNYAAYCLSADLMDFLLLVDCLSMVGDMQDMNSQKSVVPSSYFPNFGCCICESCEYTSYDSAYTKLEIEKKNYYQRGVLDLIKIGDIDRIYSIVTIC